MSRGGFNRKDRNPCRHLQTRIPPSFPLPLVLPQRHHRRRHQQLGRLHQMGRRQAFLYLESTFNLYSKHLNFTFGEDLVDVFARELGDDLAQFLFISINTDAEMEL